MSKVPYTLADDDRLPTLRECLLDFAVVLGVVVLGVALSFGVAGYLWARFFN